MKNFFIDLYAGAIGRFIRAGLATAAASWWASRQNNALYISLGPTLQALSKFLRERYPNSWWEVVPF